MKVEISDESFQFLKNLANEIRTQDNRCTASPYFYVIKDERIQCVPEGHSDEVRYQWDDGMFTREELLKEINKDPDDAIKACSDDDEKIEVFMEQQDGLITPYNIVEETYVPENHNVFLTEKACEAHIKQNAHHFRKPYSYLNHAFRNPEMESLLKAIMEIGNV